MSNIPGQKPKPVRQASRISGPFPELYLRYLRKENRTYDDAEVRGLPDPFFYNLHKQEWALKAKSAERLIKYLDRGGKDGEVFRLLEIGTGTGWLASMIANMPQYEVVGVDVIPSLLEQAARVFPWPNLDFVLGDIFEDIFPKASFDLIVLFDTLQYFPSLQQLINRCREYLKQGGEIHLLETPLWAEKEQEEAAQRTKGYYTQLGIPELVDFHHHHTKKELSTFDYQYLYRPGGLSRLFGGKDSEYPWVKVVN